MNGVDELRAAHTELRKAVRASRAAFRQSPVSRFVRSMIGAMNEFYRMRKEGVSREDGVRGIEAILRDAWPHRPSKFEAKCLSCDDTGWRELFCDDHMRCGRERCAKNPSIQHAYVEPCHCASGERKTKRYPAAEDVIAAAGKMPKRARWNS